MSNSQKKSSIKILSPVEKRIRVREKNSEHASKLAKSLDLNSVTGRILAARGFKEELETTLFLNPTLKDGLEHPSKIKNIDKACELLDKIILEKNKVAIACDFDVDGLSAGAQIKALLQSFDVPVKVFVPDRFLDGYGLNKGMIDSCVKENYKTLIALDFGTKNQEELLYAKKNGIETLVIDHHLVSSNVPASVFINPQQKGCGFAGGVLSAAGLAWYLILALRNYKYSSIDPKSYLDLACLGTICDMVPLIGPNRVIAKRGLELLDSTNRPGLVALKKVSGLKKQISCTDVSFSLGPRINAAGRIIHGSIVSDLLTTVDINNALQIAQTLNSINKERQDTELSVKDSAIQEVMKSGKLPFGIIVWDKKYHTGVVGIVAQRLVETFYRPSIVLGMDDDGIYKGSVRGIKGFNVVETLESISSELIKFGGHENAGGLSIKESNIESFYKKWDEECKKRLSKIETVPYVDVDTEVRIPELSYKLVEELKKLSPFGMGNPGPVLLTKNLKVIDKKVIKDTHLKLLLSDGENYLSSVLWRKAEHSAAKIDSKVNVAFRIETSEFNGIKELQANIQAIEPA